MPPDDRPPPSTARPDRRDIGLVLGVIACAALLVAHAWPSIPTTVDDAWISARYAWHLADGHGLVYNADEPPVEGYTNLLWVLLLALAHVVGLPLAQTMTWGGLLFGVLGLVAAAGLTAALSRGDAGPSERPHPTILLAPLLLAASPHYAVGATNGLESAMYASALLAAVWGVLVARGRGARFSVGLGLGALGLVRPEGAAMGGVLVAYDLLTRRRRLGRPDTWIPAITFGGCTGLTLLWRWATYGALVPNTFDAKASVPLAKLVEMNLTYLGHDGVFWQVAGLLLLLVPLVPPYSLRRLLVTFLGLATVAIAFRVHMWMPAGRLLLPALALTACGLASAAASEPRASWRAALSVALVGLAMAAPLTVGERVERYDRRHSVLPDNDAARAAQHLARHAPPGAWLAVRDAGVVAYHVGPGVRVAELHQRALTQPHPGGRDTDLAAVVPADPTFVVLTQAREHATSIRYGNDRRVFRGLTVPYEYLGRVYQHHHRYYDIYARADAGIPPLPEALVVNHAGPAAPTSPPKPSPR